MTTVDLYTSERRVYHAGRCLGAMVEVDFDPIAGAEFDDDWGRRHVVEAGARPTITVALPDGWEVSRQHGITNVAAGLAILVGGIPRDYASPHALLVLARSRANGLRIVAGRDPFPAEQSDLEAITQRSLFAVGA